MQDIHQHSAPAHPHMMGDWSDYFWISPEPGCLTS